MRADKFLVQSGYFDSRTQAQNSIVHGLVCANGRVVKKPSEKLDDSMEITAQAPHPWVSRAGLKLEHACEVFGVSAAGKTCLDVGASTGGFTHVMRSQGAVKIYAIDVGHGQLHDSLNGDPHIISMEKTDARTVKADMFDPQPELVVCDVSFISCMKALDVPLDIVGAGAELITLIKPQFEVGKAGIGKGGIVRDQALAQQAVKRVHQWLAGKGWQIKGQDMSPIKGGGGNTEYLVYARKEGS